MIAIFAIIITWAFIKTLPIHGEGNGHLLGNMVFGNFIFTHKTYVYVYNVHNNFLVVQQLCISGDIMTLFSKFESMLHKYEPRHVISNNVAFYKCRLRLLLSLETPNGVRSVA